MKKIIDPGKSPIIEHYCDGCGGLMGIKGLNWESLPETSYLEHSMDINGSFGYNSKADGLVFNYHCCNECGLKILDAIEALLPNSQKFVPGLGLGWNTPEEETQDED